MRFNPGEAQNQSDRIQLLSAYTHDLSIIQELMQYTHNRFLAVPIPASPPQKENELHIADWKNYAKAAKSQSVLEVLKKAFVQLNFPVEAGMSKNQNYLNALFRGFWVEGMPEAQGIQLLEPHKLEIQFIDGMAGQLPALIVEHPKDFERLVQSLLYKNEPVPVPASMGASIIKGINNWSRLRQAISDLRSSQVYRSIQPLFAQINRNKALFQDTFILVSKKPYSNVFPSKYDQKAWLNASVSIRLWHEYTHYFTSRYFGSMQNNMHDELLADYLGLHAIEPQFNAQLFLLFVGLEDYPHYRAGGRLENYLDQPPLGPQATKILHTLVFKAAHQVEAFDHQLGDPIDINDLFKRLIAIAKLHLEELADQNGLDQLLHQYKLLQ